MINLVDLRLVSPSEVVLPRARVDIDATVELVRPIIEEVARGGETALLGLSERLDHVRPPTLRVPKKVLLEALEFLDSDVRAALEESIRRSRLVHRDQRRTETKTLLAATASVTERWVPYERVGLYVPGGQAVYPSSVVMNVVPAQEAGVVSIAIASPPQASNGGYPHPTILAAAQMLGIDEVYSVGGAQAIAMFAMGAKDDVGGLVCRKVDIVTGPGNVWVAAAKRVLKGQIAIDAEAGPSEVMILADESANPEWIASDLISQAEHDALAAAVLVTPSPELAEAVIAALELQVAGAQNRDRIKAALGGEQSAILLVDSVNAGIEIANSYAAEHLEIHTHNPRSLADRVRNAGAIFVGPYSPVSLGDYCAGSNHVLPTSGSARFSSGLSVQTFLRGIHIVEYDEAALRDVAHHVIALSRAESLPAHGEAVAIRGRNVPSAKPQ